MEIMKNTTVRFGKSFLFMLAFASFPICLASPVWEWNFERKVENSYFESDKASRGKKWLNGKGRENSGVNQSTALDCGPESYNYIADFDIPWKAFTIELQFKLDKEADAKNGNTILWYASNHFGRRDFLFKITPKNELSAQFLIKTDDGSKILKNYIVKSKSLDITPGKFHKVRISSVSGGNCSIFFDDVLVASRDNALGFSDLAGKSPKYYPLLIIGGEARTGKPRFKLNGVIDDLKLYDKEMENSSPELNDSTPVSFNAFPPDIPVPLKKKITTTPFNILDVDTQGGVVFTKADRIFQKCAAAAELEMKNGSLSVKFNAPVLPSHPVEGKTNSIWSGELVEFFLADESRKVYYQYVYNVSNHQRDAFAWTFSNTRIHDWKSSFKADFQNTSNGYQVYFTIPAKEVQLNTADESNIYRINFTRSGKSTGGKSSWAKTGQNFHNISAFGTAISGSYSDFLQRQLKKITDDSKLAEDPQISRKAAALRQEISQKGDSPSLFKTFSKKLENFKTELVMRKIAGKKLIISQPGLWTDEISPGMMTVIPEKFKIRMPRNTTAFLGFAVTNMSDKRYLGRIKCMDTFPVNRFDNFPVDRFVLDRGFREAIPHDDSNGVSYYDALAELPLGQLLRIAPKETASVWLKLSSRDISPGVYKTRIVLKSASEGIDNEVIPLEVEVLPVDLGKIKIDVMHYNYIQSRFLDSFKAPKDELLKYLVERNVNYIYCNVPGGKDMDIYPPMSADGTPGKCDFRQLDRNIDLYIRNGMPVDRIKLIFYLAMDYPGYCMKNNGVNCRFKQFSDEWSAGIKSFFQQLFEHLDSKYKITRDRIVFIPVDEPRGDFNDPKSSAFKAYRYASFIKAAVPDAVLMANPYDLVDNAVCRNNLKKLAECIDIIAPYSGQLSPSLVKYIKSLNFKEYWTYNILQKIHKPEAYRKKIWENMYYGFSPVSPYWHVDQSDGGDAFCSFDVDTSYGVRRNDYATIFADFSNGKGIVSRRQEAHYLGTEDAKIIILCRQLAKGKPQAAAVEAIVAKGADGDMETIEKCRDELLEIALQLK